MNAQFAQNYVFRNVFINMRIYIYIYIAYICIQCIIDIFDIV